MRPVLRCLTSGSLLCVPQSLCPLPCALGPGSLWRSGGAQCAPGKGQTKASHASWAWSPRGVPAWQRRGSTVSEAKVNAAEEAGLARGCGGCSGLECRRRLKSGTSDSTFFPAPTFLLLFSLHLGIPGRLLFSSHGNNAYLLSARSAPCTGTVAPESHKHRCQASIPQGPGGPERAQAGGAVPATATGGAAAQPRPRPWPESSLCTHLLIVPEKLDI